jgi:phage terminase large subunit GpA-like protein
MRRGGAQGLPVLPPELREENGTHLPPEPVRTHPSAKAVWRRRRAQLLRETLKPPSVLTLSQWADSRRFLSRENAAEPGRFRTSRVEYLREVMDACTDRRIRDVVVMKAAQVAFTDGVLNNLIGYHIDQDPAPIMVVQITVDEASKWSVEKLTPMLRDTPCLATKVKSSRSRDSGNTIMAKNFPGGHLGIVGANAPAGLRARPRRVLAFDEIDGYPDSAGTEGDPIKLGEKRATTFWNRKILKGSTPTVKGFSKIETLYKQSDRRRWHCPCPHCGHEQVLVWKQVRWEKDDAPDTRRRHRTETAIYVCEGSGCVILEGERQRMLKLGRWIAESPAEPGEVKATGFHISGLMSPFLSLAELAAEFVEAKESPSLLQVFINTRLGETFEETGERVEAGTLMSRREPYAAEVPMPVGVLTLTVDVQGDRLEVLVLGWGEKEESWAIHHERLLGDPGDDTSEDNVWAQLDALRGRAWQHEGGALIRPAAVAIDYGGHHSHMVARYVKKNAGAHVYAIRGANDSGKPIWPAKPAKVGKHGVKVYEVGQAAAKDEILGSRIRRNAKVAPGPGAMHFPADRPWCNQEFFDQLVSEKKISRIEQGRPTRRWVPTRDRNEVLDLWVYGFAVLHTLGLATLRALGKRAAKVQEKGAAARAAAAQAPASAGAAAASPPAVAPAKKPAASAPPARVIGRGGWMSGLRGGR